MVKVPKVSKRRRPRLRRAVKFFELSSAIFVVVLVWWLFNRLLDILPWPYPIVPYLTWVGYVLGYLAFVAFVLWGFSKANKRAWKKMARRIGWEEDDD